MKFNKEMISFCEEKDLELFVCLFHCSKMNAKLEAKDNAFGYKIYKVKSCGLQEQNCIHLHPLRAGPWLRG